ncbi:hypothetical protein [Allomuricauda sp. d1]|uniref:hypothetical protein n=1 Tax=Allomuricauda sp. d1 TaxID=3136725 RepID=UPI0031E2BE4B
MKTATKRNVAKIEVQKSFCRRCQFKIKEELQKIEDIADINLYPEYAMVIFSFFRANELAVALNTLTEMGYPEIGEIPSQTQYGKRLVCNC